MSNPKIVREIIFISDLAEADFKVGLAILEKYYCIDYIKDSFEDIKVITVTKKEVSNG